MTGGTKTLSTLSDFENRSTARPLPDGWTLTELGDVLTFIGSGITPRGGKSVYQDYGVKFLRSQNVYPGQLRLEDVAFVSPELHEKMSRTHIQDGDVLLNITGASIGRSAIVPNGFGAANVNQHVCILRLPDSVIPSYLSWYLNSPHGQDWIMGTQSGVTRQGLNYGQIREMTLPLAPLPEQERIVAEIEKQFTRLDQAMASLRRLQSNLARYKASVLKAACDGRLVPQDPADEPADQLLARILAERRAQWQAANPVKKYKEPVGVEETAELPNLPESWVWARAEQICDFITKGTTPKAHKLFSNSGEIPFIKVYNLTFDGSLDFSIKPTFVSRKTHQGELSRSRVFPGDVLMNIVGPPLGKVSIVPELHKEWNMNQAMAVFRPMPSYSNRFLAILLMSEPILRWATKRAKATAGQFNLTLQICRDLPLPIPPLAEQERIVAEVERRLSVVTAVEQTITANLSRAERLRQSILHRAFTGRL